jgi:hypothetical protein
MNLERHSEEDEGGAKIRKYGNEFHCGEDDCKEENNSIAYVAN